MSINNEDGHSVNRRGFLAAIPALGAAPFSSAAQAPQPAAKGGKPVRTTPLTTEYPGVQFYDEQERTELNDVYEAHSPFRYYGPRVQDKVAKFEQEFSAFLGAKYTLGVTSGTAALHVALTALGVGPGDEVILPAWTWHSCYLAVLMTGALPVFAEIDESLMLDPGDVEARITPHTKAIMAVHLFGVPVDMDRILPLARKHGLKVIEDCAQSAGAQYRGKRVGALGDIGIFSFQMHKIISAGEGGAVVTNDPLLYERAVRFHDLGSVRPYHQKVLGKPSMPMFVGINYRMTELTGGVMRAQLRKLDMIVGRLRSNSAYVRERIGELRGLRLRRSNDQAGEIGWTIDFLLPDPKLRNEFIGAMRAENVPMGPPSMATPLPPAPYIAQKVAPHPAWPTFNTPRGKQIQYGAAACPRTMDLYSRAATLTMGPKYTKNDLNDVVAAIRRAHAVTLG